MSPISIRWNTVWAAKLQWMRGLDWNFRSQLHRDSIHSIAGIFRWCGCFQVRLKIQSMILWWKSLVLRQCNQLWSVRCMLSRQKMMKLNRMQLPRWFRLQRHGWEGGGQNWHWPMDNHLSGYQSRKHTSLIPRGLRKSKYIRWPLQRGTRCRVLREHGRFIDGG